jgi:hypothetical protein
MYLLFGVSTQTQSAEYIPDQSIRIESSLNVLQILTGQQTKILTLHDIDSNQKVAIPDALYPFMMQSNMITYEVHSNNNNYYYLLNTGKAFASMIAKDGINYFVIHPDACPTHYGFLWAMVPFVSTKYICAINTTIEKTHISLSLFGSINHQNQLIGSFNLSMQIQTNCEKIISGQINLQVATSSEAPEETPLYLFDIQSKYLHDVPLVEPPDTQGDTGNFTHIQISGQANRSFSIYWIPINNPNLVKGGVTFMQITGAKNLACGHDLNMKYPDFELTFTSGETIYFNGQYDIKNQSNIDVYNVSISPYILVNPNRSYRIYSNFISSP